MSKKPECCDDAMGEPEGPPHIWWSEPSDFNNRRHPKTAWVWHSSGFVDSGGGVQGVYVYITRCPYCGAALPKEET